MSIAEARRILASLSPKERLRLAIQDIRPETSPESWFGGIKAALGKYGVQLEVFEAIREAIMANGPEAEAIRQLWITYPHGEGDELYKIIKMAWIYGPRSDVFRLWMNRRRGTTTISHQRSQVKSPAP
jgi:hypothetical protein